jgi:CTP synthase
LIDVEELGGTMRLGAWQCNLAPGSQVRDIYRGEAEIAERHRHRYEFNPEFRQTVQQAGMVLSGESPDGKFVEMIELPRTIHPWFIGCQFHPEYKSKPLKAHPLFVSFIAAAFQNRLQNEASVERRPQSHPAEHERSVGSGAD